LAAFIGVAACAFAGIKLPDSSTFTSGYDGFVV
jgi:hypothetical protein